MSKQQGETDRKRMEDEQTTTRDRKDEKEDAQTAKRDRRDEKGQTE